MTGILIDENLPASLVLPTSLPVFHASVLGSSPTDAMIWSFAESKDLVIFTKDSDFSFRIASSSPPPRVVHLRIGNLRLEDLRALVQKLWPQVMSHFPSAKLINVYSDRLEVVY